MANIFCFKQTPFLMARDSSSSAPVKERYEGYIIDLVDAVTEAADLNYTLHDNYEDLFQGLIDNKIDLVVADLTMTTERAEIIDFSIPFMTVGLSILTKKPSIKDPAPFSFLSPFSVSIWLSILLAYVAVSCLLTLVSRLV